MILPSRTLISFGFFMLLGGASVLLGPKLAGTLLPDTVISRQFSPAGETPGTFVEISAPELAVAGKSEVPPAPEAGVESHWLDFGGVARRWWGFDGSRGQADAKVVLLLHGSGRSGRDMMQPWQQLARREGLVLIAPDAADAEVWSREKDGNQFLDAVLGAAEKLYRYDAKHALMFGHSAGANFALTLAAEPPEGVTAIAVHAGAAGPAAAPENPLPLRIYVGDEDHLFPLDAVRNSARRFGKAGHDTDLVVIPGHDHWFYDAAPGIAADSWNWFSSR